MARPIDADALRESVKKKGTSSELIWCVAEIDRAPTIDAEPVRHGTWEEEDERSAYKGFLVSCSECGAFLDEEKKEHFAYCYRCGAKMKGE